MLKPFEKIDILFHENHVQAHFLNFGEISFINKEIVSFVQLHTYKFGLVYKSLFNTMKKQRRGLNRYNVLRDIWRSMDCQTTPLEKIIS